MERLREMKNYRKQVNNNYRQYFRIPESYHNLHRMRVYKAIIYVIAAAVLLVLYRGIHYSIRLLFIDSMALSFLSVQRHFFW